MVRLGVKLPIEARHQGGDLAPRSRDPVQGLPLDLRLRQLPAVATHWAIKPSAIINSGFREVLWLDSDNFPIRDPGFLFEDAEYKNKGSLFWRDVSGADRACYWYPGGSGLGTVRHAL